MTAQLCPPIAHHNTLLSLGSNVGDCIANLAAATEALRVSGVRVVASASVYLTEPKERSDQPWFYNTALLAATEIPPHELLRICRDIEATAGRLRIEPYGPRTLDIDIVFIDALIIRTPDLIVPHPKYRERRFVLEPIAEIAPLFRDPCTGRTMQELLAQCPDQGQVRRLSEKVP